MDNIVNGLITALKIKQDEIKESMVNGRFVNFESYQRFVGIYIGYENALEILNNLLEEKDRNDDEL
jgi:hypothetical protein